MKMVADRTVSGQEGLDTPEERRQVKGQLRSTQEVKVSGGLMEHSYF